MGYELYILTEELEDYRMILYYSFDEYLLLNASLLHEFE